MATCYRHPDRETGLTCSVCERPICTECMTMAPVGIRCPEHASGTRRPLRRAGGPQLVRQLRGAYVTRALVIVNVAVYLITVSQGAGLNAPGGRIFVQGVLYGPAVANGDWWRLVTSMFLHASLAHIALNMLGLWWLGSIVEEAIGHGRYLLLYFVSGLAGSLGALVAQPSGITVGASGAIFGILGALLILEYLATGSLAGQAMLLIVVNLAFSFTASNISVGGHIGGLVAGILGTVVLARFRYRRQAIAVAALVAIGAASVVLSYLRVKGHLG